MKKSLVLVLFTFLLAVLGATAAVFSPPQASLPAPKAAAKTVALTVAEIQALIDQGKIELQSHNILAARDKFAQAVSADANHQEANLLYALTRVFAIVEQPGNSAGLDSVREIFEASGFSFQTFGLYGMDGTGPEGGPAAGTPRTGVVLDFVKLKVLTEIDAALGNLAKVTSPTFSSTITPAAIATSGSNLEIDYADALVIKALLNAVKCNLNLLMVYGLDVSLPQIAAAPDQLLTYKKLFADDATLLAVKDAPRLGTARAALLAFIDTYTSAVPLLQGRSGAGHHLFVVDALVSNEPIDVDAQDLDDVAFVLAEIKEALNGPRVLAFVQTTLEQDRKVDLSKFFNPAAPIDIRARLGNCSTGTMSNDATIGGLFPDGLSAYQDAVAEVSGDLLGVVCTGFEKPKIQLDPDYLNLSEYQGYSSGPQGVTIRNVGTAPLTASSITLGGNNGGDFLLKAGTCSSLTPILAAGAACSVTVDVKRPVASPGFRSASVEVVSNDSSSPFSSAQINGWLDQTGGAMISGLARDSRTGAGIDGRVALYDGQNGVEIASSWTNDTGGYAFTGLDAGSYKLYFSPYNHPGDTQFPSQWYNGKTSQGGADLVNLAAGQQLSDVDFTLAPSAVTLGWGGVWHQTRADGSRFDVLDTGINSSATSLAGLTLTVDGPGGFSYTFAEADKSPFLNGRFSLFKSYPSGTLAAGVYTFTLTDAYGNKSYRVATRPAVPASLPKVDSATIKYQRKADGSYRFSWAPVSASKTYYYRLRIALNDSVGAPVYFSTRSMASVVDVPLPAGVSSPLVDGTAYKVRVEVMDAPSVDLTTSRSDSAFVNFTPQASQYNASRLLVNAALLYNRKDSDGTLSTDAVLSVLNPAAVTSWELRNGSGAVVQTFQTSDKSNQDYYKKITPALAAGSYTLRFVANGLEHLVPVTLAAPVSYPIPNSATMQAEDLGNDQIRFSWANVDVAGPIYYRIYVFDKVTGPAANGASYSSMRMNTNYVDVPKTLLGDLATKQWRVEVTDSAHSTTQRNRVNGAYLDLNPVPFSAERPVINSWRLRSMTSSGGVTRTQVLVNAAAPGGVLSEIRVTGPNGYSRNLLSQGSYLPAYFAYVLEEAGAPAAGLYTITAKESSGKSATRYLYQPAPHAVPAVDFRTMRSNLEPNGDLRISWAPVLSDLPVWYQVSIYNSADQNGDRLMDAALYTPTGMLDVNFDGVSDQLSVFPLASVVVPASQQLPASTMIQITGLDGGQSVTSGSSTMRVTNVIHNASQSAMVKTVRGLFNYGTLTDADGDGFASNLDSNDANASVYPFSWANLKPLTVQNGGSGSGTVTSSPAGIACLTGSAPGCSAGFTGGSQVTLSATVSNGSVFGGWSGACSGTGSCLVTMDGAKTVSAAFNLKPATVRIDGVETSYYGIGAALDQVTSGEKVVRAKGENFPEHVILDNAATVLFKGGFTDLLFSLRSPTSFTVLDGSLKIRQGTLKPERLKLR